jgi:glycosyltransferase involved in cell wall biosynthesis
MSDRSAFVASVIVYCEGDDSLVDRTLASLGRQAQPGSELLLVAEASKVEGAYRRAQSLCGVAATEIGFLVLEPPISTPGRNRAIALAQGIYVCELVAGAVIAPTMLTKCVWALATRPQAGVVVVRVQIEAQPASSSDQIGSGDAPQVVAEPSAQVYRKAAWAACGGLNEMAPAEAADRDFRLRAVERHWVVVSVRETLASFQFRWSGGPGLIASGGIPGAEVWLRAHHWSSYFRAGARRSAGRLLARALDRSPAMRSVWRRVSSKLAANELTEPRQFLRHPLDSLLLLVPERYKGVAWTRRGLPRAANAWVDVPPLLHLSGAPVSAWGATVDDPADRRTRLLVIHTQLIPGGVETALLNLVTSLDRDRFGIDIVTTDSEPGDLAPDPWAPRFAGRTDGIYRLPSFLERRWFLRFVVDLIKTKKIDVVLVSLSPFAYNSLAQIRAACPDTAILDLLHAEAPYLRMDSVRLADRHRQHLDRRIVVTDALQAVLVSKYGESPERVVVIRNGVDTRGAFNPAIHVPGLFRQSTGIRPGVAIVLYFGRLASEKQPMHIVEVATRLRHRTDIAFVLVGDGPDRPALKDAIAERGLANIVMQPARDDIEVALADADLVIFPSKREGLPMSGIEAMAMAKPVVASRVPGWAELIDDGIDGFLVADGDFVGYARVVAQLVDEPALGARMGSAGRRKAVADYDLREFGRAWERVLSQPRVDSRAPYPHDPPQDAMSRTA